MVWTIATPVYLFSYRQKTQFHFQAFISKYRYAQHLSYTTISAILILFVSEVMLPALWTKPLENSPRKCQEDTHMVSIGQFSVYSLEFYFCQCLILYRANFPTFVPGVESDNSFPHNLAPYNTIQWNTIHKLTLL